MTCLVIKRQCVVIMWVVFCKFLCVLNLFMCLCVCLYGKILFFLTSHSPVVIIATASPVGLDQIVESKLTNASAIPAVMEEFASTRPIIIIANVSPVIPVKYFIHSVAFSAHFHFSAYTFSQNYVLHRFYCILLYYYSRHFIKDDNLLCWNL